MLIPKYTNYTVETLKGKLLRKAESSPSDRGINRLFSQLMVKSSPKFILRLKSGLRDVLTSDRVRITSSAYKPMGLTDASSPIPAI